MTFSSPFGGPFSSPFASVFGQDAAGRPELVVNGDFATDISGWTNNDTGVATFQSGRLRLERTGSGTTSGMDLQRQTIMPTVIGQSYDFKGTIRYVTADNTGVNTFGGLGIDGIELMAGSDRNALGFDTDELLSTVFVATATSHIITMEVRGGATGVVSFDNISFR
jgi:hypothetical protein